MSCRRMGRTVGANADDTRRRLRAAADVAGAAGLSNSALTCSSTSRADLLIGAALARVVTSLEPVHAGEQIGSRT